MTIVKASIKGVRISPRKLGLVASLVRGRSVADALTILEHTPKKAAPMLMKAINSAAANARQTQNARVEDLLIAELQIDRGPSMKRYFTAARGAARPYKKRTSHINIAVSAPEKTKAVKPAEAKADKPAAKTAVKEKK